MVLKSHFTESSIEETALEWFKDMGYAIVFGGEIAPENRLASLRGGISLPRVVRGESACNCRGDAMRRPYNCLPMRADTVKMIMKFVPKIHPFDQAQDRHRKSIRLKGYDYTSAGAYFITIVTYQRECLFGDIQNGEMTLSAMGQIADENWRAIPEHFPQVELGAFVVMPNHAHGVIIIHPDVGVTHWVAPTTVAQTENIPTKPNGPKRGSIGAIIGAYKMSVTRRIQKELNGENIWQRNYYEHIIRNDDEHNRIHLYIESNIDNWATDEENPIKPK